MQTLLTKTTKHFLLPILFILFSSFILLFLPPPGLNNAEPIGPFINGTLPSIAPNNTDAEIALTRVYENIVWESPIVAIPFPTTNNMLIVEMDGRFFTVSNDENTGNRNLVLDIQDKSWYYDWSSAGSKHGGIQNVVFHPQFGLGQGKDYMYVYYLFNENDNSNSAPYYNRLSRFTWNGSAFTRNSELIMINQYDTARGHDGSGMAFGSDGFLYVAVGDEGTQNGAATAHTQKIDDRFRSGVWRIDVDQRGGNISHPIIRQPSNANVPNGSTGSYTQGYYIPNNNPWVDPSGGTLEEFYAIGLRQPWRMTYDAPTGNFWIGDVGGGQREEISVMGQPGLNFEWNYKEGTVDGFRAAPSPLIGTSTPPVFDSGRSEFTAIIGGYVYRGNDLPQLQGKYLMADLSSGRVYSLSYNGGNTHNGVEQILTVPETSGVFGGVGSFGINHDKEVLALKLSVGGTQGDGQIYRISASGGSNSGNGTVTLFQSCNYNFAAYPLSIGVYPDVRSIGIPDNYISSIQIPAGITVTAYESINFGGNSITLTSNTSCLLDNDFNDKISSIKIQDASATVTLFESCNYNFAAYPLSIGDYPDVRSIGIPNDFISSIQIPAGITVTAYESINFGGNSITLTSNTSCLLDNNFNDKISSIKIQGRSDLSTSALPTKLSQTGIFANLSNLTPAQGIIPYDVNNPLWSAGTDKLRWVALPNDGTINSANERIGYQENGDWTFPIGTVFIKQFGHPDGRKLETRVWIHGTDGVWFGATYKWNTAGTDADLLSEGLEEQMTIEGETFDYTYPSINQCKDCHNSTSGWVLGYNTQQLNRDILYPTTGQSGNQLETLSHLGFIPSVNTNTVLTAAALDDNSASLELRARSYLESNCAHCHRPNGVRGLFDARMTTGLSGQGLILGEVEDNMGIAGSHVITPQSIEKSAIFQRMNSTDECCLMPILARGRQDKQGIQSIANWINSIDADCANSSNITLGNTLSDGNFIDGHNPAILINENDTYTNTSGGIEEVCIVDFNFYARRLGNPVTPFIAKVNGDNNFTILTVGETRTSANYRIGNNSFSFSNHSDDVIMLNAGETIAVGFMDAFPNSPDVKIQSVIPAQQGTAEDEVWQTYTASSTTNPALFPTLNVGKSPGLGTAGIATHLKRSYKFNIGIAVEAIDNPVTGDCGDNLAIGKSATQSSTLPHSINFSANKAIDGNFDGNHTAGSLSHTNFEQNAWWEIDLGEIYELTSVRLWNRTNCCSERLSNFHVLVSDASFNSTALNTTINQNGVGDFHFPGTAGRETTINLGRTGRYLRIQLSGNNALQLAEVELFGCAVSSPTDCEVVTLPRRIEAEDFCDQFGVQAENTGDVGGGQNIGYIQTGDWMEYEIRVTASGMYGVDYRVAAKNASGGSIQLQLNGSNIGSISIPSTGGWQIYTTITNKVNLTAGTHTLRVFAQQAGWNLNWFEFHNWEDKSPIEEIPENDMTTESCDNGTSIIYGAGTITMDGGSYYQVLDANWQEVFNCGWNCGSSQTVENLAAGDYRVYIKNNTYQVICEKVITLFAGGTNGGSNPGNQEENGGGTAGANTTCGSIAVTYGNGEITFTGLPNKDYFFKVNDLDNGWADAGNCGWNCGNEFIVNNLSNGRYLLTVYNADWSPHCETEITMTGSSIVGGATDRQAPHLSFTAYPANRTIDLQWLSNSGFKVRNFAIEHSNDGINFEQLAQLVNKEWSSEIAYHQTTDETPLMGENYYRIKEIYLDGSFAYTDVKQVNFQIDLDKVSIFPNPARDELFLNLTPYVGKKASLSLVNHLGKQLIQQDIATVSTDLMSINTTQIQNGLYYLIIEVDGQKLFTKKVLIHRLY